MKQYTMLDTVQRSLKNAAFTLDQVWSDHAQVWQQLGWNQSQVKLWLACLPEMKRETISEGTASYQLASNEPISNHNLADELVALLVKADRPMPLTQLLGKLPAGQVVTEPMLRAAAMQDARLDLKGPLVKLA